MFVALDLLALLGGVGLVAAATRDGARSRSFERAGGALLVGGFVALGLLLVRASG